MIRYPVDVRNGEVFVNLAAPAGGKIPLAEKVGRPSLAPGVYFRLMLLGFFEGIDSERGMAWRAAAMN